MQLTIILSLVLTFFTFGSCYPVVKLNPALILSDISQLSRDVSGLTKKITSCTGDKTPLAPFAIAFFDIKFLLESTVSDVKAIGSFNYDDSTDISNALQDLAPSVVTLLIDLDKKVRFVAEKGYTTIVHSALETLSADTNDLLNALTNAVSLSSVGGISTVNAQVSATFTAAIAAYAH